MNYEGMFEVAQHIIQEKRQSRQFICPGDTVCVLLTKSGNFYAGTNCKSMQMGRIFNAHAELQAVQNMLSAGENALSAVMLLDLRTGQPFLPCVQCIGYLMSLNPENYACQIVLGKDTVTMGDISQSMYSAYSQNAQSMQNQPLMMQNVR